MSQKINNGIEDLNNNMKQINLGDLLEHCPQEQQKTHHFQNGMEYSAGHARS